MSNILVVDDEKALVALMKNILEKEHHVVTAITDPMEVLKVNLNQFQLIILDIMMPGIDGYSLCMKIRDKVDCPIIFLSAKSMEQDIVKGLSLGADDYLVKPFGADELRMRVQAHLRREMRQKRYLLDFGDIQLDLSGKQFLYKGEPVQLTKGEYGICEVLAMNPGQVFSREKLYEKVFGYDGEGDSDSIMQHVKNIRTKLSALGISPIETVLGIGYKWK